jgi:methionyl aminopeptidase
MQMRTAKIKRNDPCPCGSGKKYKKCCLGKPEIARRDDDLD